MNNYRPPKKDQLAHKIRLKKQLAKAYKSEPAASTPKPVYDQEEESADQSAVAKDTAKRPRHQQTKPDRFQEARSRHQQLLEERAAAQQAKDEAIRAKEAARTAAQQRRASQRRALMNSRTRKGQPVLSRHIDHLLEKITNSKV